MEFKILLMEKFTSWSSGSSAVWGGTGRPVKRLDLSSFQDKLAKQDREQKWKYFELFSDDNYLKCQGIEEGKKKKVSTKFSLKKESWKSMWYLQPEDNSGPW